MHSVLLEAFDEVIREKLVFDDRAAVFFKMGLQECRRQSFISEAEFIEWDLKSTKVNVENSEWARQIKQSLHQVECRVTTAEKNVGLLHAQYSALRDALIQREECEIRRRARDRLISLMSSALAMCGGLVIKDIFGAAFDLWDPAKLLGALTGMSSDKLADFLAEKTSTIVFKDGVEAVLINSDIEPVEFADVLRDAVNLQHPDIASTAPQTLLPIDTEPVSSFLPSKHSILRLKAVALAVVYREVNAQTSTVHGAVAVESPSPVGSKHPHEVVNSLSEADLEPYPYHYAVRYSDGDLDQFLELVGYIDDCDGGINKALTLCVRSTEGEPWKACELTALVYASYLGYVDIAKWFLEKPDVVLTEKKFVTIKRARSYKANPVIVGIVRHEIGSFRI